MKKIAVILAGCGRLDGSEVHESVLTLLSICQAGATYQCFSLDLPQNHVNNHLTNEVVSESRNMLIESARIARGDVKSLETLNSEDYDGLIIPGGSGIAYNLFSLALCGDNYQVNPLVAQKCRSFTKLNKPVGFICIAPVMVPKIYSFPVEITVGNDEKTITLIQNKGAIHHQCTVDQIWVDHQHKIVSTPAYMLANNIGETYTGINKLVNQVLKLSI